MRGATLQETLDRLAAAIRDVQTALDAVRAEHDPLASYIFVSRRQYLSANDTKSGKRREVAARLSYNAELGFRGSLDEWARLMGVAAEW